MKCNLITKKKLKRKFTVIRLKDLKKIVWKNMGLEELKKVGALEFWIQCQTFRMIALIFLINFVIKFVIKGVNW